MSDQPGGAAAATKPTRMLPQERRWGVLVAGATLVGFVAVNTPWNGGSHASLGAFGVLLSLVLGATVWWGNRIAGAFASVLVAFGPWGAAAIAGAVPMAYGFLLGFRVSRATNGPAAERARQRREARAAARASGSSRRSAGAPARAATARKPIETKRVTPKKTPPRGGGRRLSQKKR